MATARELRQLLRPLLKRRPDLALGRRELFFLPLTHYLRGVAFTVSRRSKRFEAHSIVSQLFNGSCGLPDDGNDHQPSYEVSESWVDDPERASAELCRHLEQRALPLVAAITGPREHENAPEYMPLYFDDTPPLKFANYAFTVALGACFPGDFERAKRVLTDVLVYYGEFMPTEATEEFRFGADLFGRMAYLLRLLRTERARIPQLLHDWEAYRVDSLKLTKYWKPTPFPCDAIVAAAPH